jgi:hypothetical protein
MFENIENDRKIKWSPILVTIKTRSKSINFVALVPALIFFGETQKQASTVYHSLVTEWGALHRLNCSVSLYCCDLQKQDKSGLSFTHSQF